MTDKLHCPFCEAELQEYGTIQLYGVCPNRNCITAAKTMKTEIWQALIDGKKAQDALNRAKQKLDLIAFHTGEDCHIAHELRRIAKDGLDEITSITKQEK